MPDTRSALAGDDVTPAEAAVSRHRRVAAASLASLPAVLLTLGIGGIGGVVFWLVGAPAAFLTGSAVAVTLAVVLRVPTSLPDPVRLATFSIIGAMMGAGISPGAIAQLSDAPVAIAGLVAVIALATLASYQVLRRVGRWDSLSALCGSIPGNLSVVLAVSLERGARMDRVVMAQATRLFLLVALVPFVLGGSEAATLRVTTPSDATLVDVALTVVIALGAALLARAVRLPGATFLGPLIVAAALSASGLVTIAVPVWLAAGAFTILGASVAVRFAEVRRDGLVRMILVSIASFVAAVAVAIAGSFAFAWLLSLPVGEVFLAFAPGGLDAMIALSFLLHYEVAFVTVMHTARVIVLSLAMPIGVALLSRRGDPSAKRDPQRVGGDPG